MSRFKSVVAADVRAAFINTAEFGDVHTIDGKAVACVVDGDLLQRRPGGLVTSEGVFLEEFVVFLATAELDYIPVVEQRIRFDGNHYYVKRCHEEMGVLQITLTANET